ncbi:MAG: biotin/lipoyl-binding carrier protein [Actinomycetota bacterium]
MRHRIEAELVANVIDVTVRPGMVLSLGDTVVILESMKMEIPVQTEWAGTIMNVGVIPGDVVNEGDLIAIIDDGS